MNVVLILMSVLYCSFGQASWTNISTTAYSYKGEDPGPAALSACNQRVNNYVHLRCL
jgi:hypothetical protein